MSNLKKSILATAYLLGIIAGYPIIKYLSYFLTNNYQYEGDKYVVARVFLSGPLLIITGVFIFFNKGFINKLIGLFFLIGGITWCLLIIKEFGKESG